jgi:lipid-A-disaccharide synthase
LLPVLRELFNRLPGHRFLVAAMTDLPRDMYRPVASLPNVELHYDSALEVIHAADTGLIKSGTSTLQAALLGLPQVVFYRINPVSAWIMRKLALIQYVSLPNLIAGKEVVRELLQKDFTIDRLVAELGRLDQKEVREFIGEEYAGIKKQLAKSERTADRVARSIFDLTTKTEGNG